MPQQSRFFNGVFQHLLRAYRKLQRRGFYAPDGGEALRHFLHTGGFQPQFAQGVAGNTAFLFDESQQYVFGIDRGMPHSFRFLVSQ